MYELQASQNLDPPVDTTHIFNSFLQYFSKYFALNYKLLADEIGDLRRNVYNSTGKISKNRLFVFGIGQNRWVLRFFLIFYHIEFVWISFSRSRSVDKDGQLLQ
jgi:hypothetical protein